MDIDTILEEREKTHGEYEEVARVYAHLKLGLELSRNSVHLKSNFHSPQKLALEMICLKMARIVCGSPNFADHWDDIAGYAELGKGKEERGMLVQAGCGIISPQQEIGQCSICNRVLHETDIRKNTKDGEPFVCLGCYLNEVPEWKREEENSTSSKMEHAPICDRCGTECETTCFTISDIDSSKRFCPKCIGEIAGEECRKGKEAISKMEATDEWVSINEHKPQVGRKVEVKGYGFQGKNATMYCCMKGCFWKYPEIKERVYLSDSFVTHWRYMGDDELSEIEAAEDEWYDAEKCLPKFNRRVIIECKNAIGEIGNLWNVETKICNDFYSWVVFDSLGNEKSIPHAVLRWKYADE